MIANSFVKTLLAGMAAILLEGTAQAQINVLSKPVFGQVTMGIGSGSYAPSWNVYGQAPDYITSFFMPSQYTTCSGSGFAYDFRVEGFMGCGPNQNMASSGATYQKNIYADAVPGSNVRVKITANFNISWSGIHEENRAGFNFYAVSGKNVGAQVDRITQAPVIVGALSNSGQWAAAVQPSANFIYEAGKTYYKLGMAEVIGKAGVYEVNGGAGYNSEITGIEAHYIGKSLSLSGGDNQKRRVNEALPDPLSVKVADMETGELASGVPITFSLIAPVNGAHFSNGGTSIIANTAAGIAAAGLTLGAAVGTYKVKATCPPEICTSGAREVTFTATAVDKELVCVNCGFSGKPGQPLNNPFELKVVDKLTGMAVSSVPVAYNVISFINKNGNTIPGPNGATLNPENTTSDSYGFSRSRLKLGADEGTYIVRARCETCLSGQEQIARGTAKTYDTTAGAGGNAAGDPGANGGDCPGGCCPVTPVLRMKMVTPPNDGVSFTSAGNENLIGLNASVLPVCLNDSVNVIWQVGDDPDDYMDSIDSGNPMPQPAPGPVSSFRVVNLPAAPAGRPLPLSYKVTAHIIRNGVMNRVDTKVRQDEIDKCRQEYIDFGIPLMEVPRSKFTIGLDGFGTPFDCYAHIFPHERYDEVVELRKSFTIQINSGYRSPRANKFVARSKTIKSWHLFGRAMDIEVLPETPLNYYSLWTHTKNPKLLENSSGYLVKRDSSGKLIIGDDVGGYPIPLVFFEMIGNGWLHLGE